MEPTIADELNENHLWHKVVGAMLAKHGDQSLAPDDFGRIAGKTVVVSHSHSGTVLTLRLVDDAEADRLSREFQSSARRKN